MNIKTIKESYYHHNYIGNLRNIIQIEQSRKEEEKIQRKCYFQIYLYGLKLSGSVS